MQEEELGSVMHAVSVVHTEPEHLPGQYANITNHHVYTTVTGVFMKVLGLRRLNRQKWIVIK